MLLESIELRRLCAGMRKVMCVYLKELEASLTSPFASVVHCLQINISLSQTTMPSLGGTR